VIADTPAAGAGIRAGDVVVAINGEKIADYADLDAALAADGGRLRTSHFASYAGSYIARLPFSKAHTSGDPQTRLTAFTNCTS
jgi:membrane-associated protease RseP (regulator of RpoE activity)